MSIGEFNCLGGLGEQHTIDTNTATDTSSGLFLADN